MRLKLVVAFGSSGPLSGTDEFKRRLGSTLDELICKRLADLPFTGTAPCSHVLTKMNLEVTVFCHSVGRRVEEEYANRTAGSSMVITYHGLKLCCPRLQVMFSQGRCSPSSESQSPTCPIPQLYFWSGRPASSRSLSREGSGAACYSDASGPSQRLQHRADGRGSPYFFSRKRNLGCT